jgi:hypothetical protein
VRLLPRVWGTTRLAATSATPCSGRMPAAPGWPRNGRTQLGGSTPPWPPSWPTTGPPPWPASPGTASTSERSTTPGQPMASHTACWGGPHPTTDAQRNPSDPAPLRMRRHGAAREGRSRGRATATALRRRGVAQPSMGLLRRPNRTGYPLRLPHDPGEQVQLDDPDGPINHADVPELHPANDTDCTRENWEGSGWRGAPGRGSDQGHPRPFGTAQQKKR